MYPTLVAEINNLSPHSFPLGSDGISEALSQQGSRQPLPFDQSWHMRGNSPVILRWPRSTCGVTSYSTHLLAALTYWVHWVAYYPPGSMLIYFNFCRRVVGRGPRCCGSPVPHLLQPILISASAVVDSSLGTQTHLSWQSEGPVPWISAFLSQDLLWCFKSLLGGTQVLSRSAGT